MSVVGAPTAYIRVFRTIHAHGARQKRERKQTLIQGPVRSIAGLADTFLVGKAVAGAASGRSASTGGGWTGSSRTPWVGSLSVFMVIRECEGAGDTKRRRGRKARRRKKFVR